MISFIEKFIVVYVFIGLIFYVVASPFAISSELEITFFKKYTKINLSPITELMAVVILWPSALFNLEIEK